MNYNPYIDTPPDQMNPFNRPPIDFERYWKLLRKKKYYIFLIIVSVSVLWTAVFFMFLNKVEYTSSTIIKFDDPRANRGTAALTEFAIMDPASKTAILRTRSFLERVVRTLHYDWRIKEAVINPAAFIKAIEDPEVAPEGEYTLVQEGNRLKLFYSNSGVNIKNKLLETKTTDTGMDAYTFEKAGGLTVNTTELYLSKTITIYHLPIEYAIDIFDGNLTDDLDRTRTVFTLSYTDKNADYAALVVNTLADLFVQQLLDHKRIQTSSILVSLQSQLESARRDMVLAESELRSYRESHPLVYLASDRQQVVTELSSYETDLRERKADKQTIDRLTGKLQAAASREERVLVYQEIIGLLQNRQVPGIDLIIERYQRIQSDKQKLLAENFSPENVQVKILDKQLDDLRGEVDTKLREYKIQLDSKIAALGGEINKNYADLKNLPGRELRLAELERNRQIKNDVVSRIMARIEEAKVSDAAVLPEAYIIDKAKPQYGETGDMKKKLMVLAAGPLLGLALGIFLFIAVDLLDPTVKSAKELETKTKLKLLAAIPVIYNENVLPDSVKSSGEVDPKLITSDYAPVMASEQFRFMRTKLSMGDQNGHQRVIVTSLSPGEGKSLVAANLAVTFAQKKMQTLLLDCDLRRGILHKTFNGKKKPGMADLLASTHNIDDMLVDRVIQETHVPHLFLISAGTLVPNPSELLSGERMQTFLENVKQKFHMIIFDTPPIGLVPDAMALNTFIHNILLVARERKTNLKRLKHKLNEFSFVEKDFKYVILNASKDADAQAYEAYSYYNY